jgi:hypothetical protein
VKRKKPSEYSRRRISDEATGSQFSTIFIQALNDSIDRKRIDRASTTVGFLAYQSLQYAATYDHAYGTTKRADSLHTSNILPTDNYRGRISEIWNITEDLGPVRGGSGLECFAGLEEEERFNLVRGLLLWLVKERDGEGE